MLAVIAHSSSYDKLHQMVSLVATAASLGEEVRIFFTHGALLVYAEERWDDSEPRQHDAAANDLYREGVEEGRVPPLSQLFAEARAVGDVKHYACSQTVKALKMDTDQCRKMDGIVGYATFYQATREARLVVV